MKTRSSGALRLAATLAFAIALPAATFAEPLLHHTPTADYVTGGVSREEADYLRTRAPGYPLEIVFSRMTDTGAGFAADVHLRVLDAAGREVLVVPAADPIVLARLGPGRYTIEATYEGRTRTAAVTVGERHQKVGFTW